MANIVSIRKTRFVFSWPRLFSSQPGPEAAHPAVPPLMVTARWDSDVDTARKIVPLRGLPDW
jgi:hypothetical protein